LQQTADALRSFGDLPVGLLPGNHDAATADPALLRLELAPSVSRHPGRRAEPLGLACR
jgi:DNA repair exonuclease SbcCD nuclease subunit